MEKEKELDVWEISGNFFGYPKCCINSFVKRGNEMMSLRKVIPHSEEVEKVIDNNGFIPCKECAKKVTKETLSTLITNRISTLPYPQDHNSLELINYINKIEKEYDNNN